jgi:hypothetical protein
MQTFSSDVFHTFALTRKRLICAEQLWMSDSAHPSHYRKTHSLNKGSYGLLMLYTTNGDLGAKLVGSIEADLTFLKEQNLIQPQLPSIYSTHVGSRKQHWVTHYEVAMVVQGRSIRFEARWPVKRDLKPGQSQAVLAMKLVGIAAAFQPGTA